MKKDTRGPWYTELYNLLDAQGAGMTMLIIGMFIAPGVLLLLYLAPGMFIELDIFKILLLSAMYTWSVLAVFLGVDALTTIIAGTKSIKKYQKNIKNKFTVLTTNLEDRKRSQVMDDLEEIDVDIKSLDSYISSHMIAVGRFPERKNIVWGLFYTLFMTLSIILSMKYIAHSSDINSFLANTVSIYFPVTIAYVVGTNSYRSKKFALWTLAICLVVMFALLTIRACI